MKPHLVNDPRLKIQPRKRPGRHSKKTRKSGRKQTFFGGGRCR